MYTDKNYKLTIEIKEDGSVKVKKFFNGNTQVLDLHTTEVEFLFEKIKKFYKNSMFFSEHIK